MCSYFLFKNIKALKKNQLYVIPVSLRALKWKHFLKEEEHVRKETKNLKMPKGNGIVYLTFKCIQIAQILKDFLDLFLKSDISD